METAAINMNQTEASIALRRSREAIAKYRSVLKGQRKESVENARLQMEREDEEMNRIYREISQGRQVINLYETFRMSGCDEHGLPKLAIARADALKVWYWPDSAGGTMYTSNRWSGPKSTRFQIPLTWLPGHKTQNHTVFEAIVPLIPVRFRPKAKLMNYHILFEAEWRRAVPVDPILLRHVGGVHYAVLAHWDLTEVERAALFGRLV